MNLARKLAEFAEQLPIGKILGELDFSHTGILIGETACGKSLVTPLLAYLTGGFRRVIVRQPTRLASYLAMKSMYDIYGDAISVGCINRDQKINPDAPIVEITDGILVDWLRDKQIWYDELIILDEIHATSEQLEIAMGLIKRQELYPWCLTATIDPGDITNYFNAEVHYVSGINYPIYKKQVYKQLRSFLLGNDREKGYIKEKILEGGNSCLVFLPTRYETEYWASEIDQIYGNQLICKYIHGGVDVRDMASFSHKENLDKPFILFSTPVSEQSITLDINDVIIVNQKIVVNEYMGIKRQKRTYLPPNSLIQMMGRCGRYRDGHVYVLCEDFTPEIDFNSLKATPVIYSLSNNTPYELAIILADRRIKLEDVDLISEVDKREYHFAVRMLKKRKIIDYHGNLTKEGEAVMAIPLDYNLAQFVATAPEQLLDIVIFTSGFGSHGLYHVERLFPEGTPPDVLKRRKRLAVTESDLLTKYNIARQFYGLSEEEMKIKAQDFGFNIHVITNALNAANSVYVHMNLTPPETLPPLNKQLIKEFQEHVFNIMLYPPVKVNINYNTGSYNCYIDDLRAFTDSSSTIQGGDKEIIFAARTQVENRYGEWFIRFSDSTICPRNLREWCWPEETVREFLRKSLVLSDGKEPKYEVSESRYPVIAKFIRKLVSISKELKSLYAKSPERFKTDRISFRDILEDTFIDICINERIKKIKSLESYLEKEDIPEPSIEDFISLKDIKYVNKNYPDNIMIRDKKYNVIYKSGLPWVEVPYELVLDLKENEAGNLNFIVLIEEKNGNITRINTGGLKRAKEDIKDAITLKYWKKVKRDVKHKINTNQVNKFLYKALVRKYVTEFLGEPIYGWTGIKSYGYSYNVELFNSLDKALAETKKSISEYIKWFIQAEVNVIKKRIPSGGRRKRKQEITSHIYELQDWCEDKISGLSEKSMAESFNKIMETIRNKISYLKDMNNYNSYNNHSDY